MVITLKNDQLEVQISDLGAEILSVKRGDCEYIWQGNPVFWKSHAPVLFPICGRLFGGKYTYGGKTYEMNLHGFARASVYHARQDGNKAVFTLVSIEESRKIYPFDFQLEVTYELVGDKLTSTINIRNTGKEVLPATCGLHPGFNVPFDKGNFEDWYIEFDKVCSPDEVVFSDTCFNTGKKRALSCIEEGKYIRLRHSLFNIDAVFMASTDRKLTLKSEKSDRYVTFSFPDMPYVGLWHAPRTEAPYVCIEPWCGLPAYDGETRDLATAPDFFRIQPRAEKQVEYSIIFG